MNLRTVMKNYRYLFGLLFVLTVGPAIGFGISGSESVLVGVSFGVFVGSLAFICVALVLVAIILGDRRHIRLLQGLFLGLITMMMVGNVIGGRTLSDAVIFGFFGGALAFIPIVTLFALLFLAYRIGVQSGKTPKSS